jgi:hypothetical protein
MEAVRGERLALTDTDPEAARVQLDLLRRAPVGARLRLAFSLSRTVIDLSRRGLARRHPGDSPEEVALRFAAVHYGPGLAEELRCHLRSRRP